MLQKSAININFSQGLDTKTDPKQVQVGKFLALKNTIFTKGGLLQKRNGYAPLSNLPNTAFEHVTTFNGNLTAIGSQLAAYSQGSATWVNTGNIQPMNLTVAPIVRSNTNQTQADSVVAPNNLVCTVYTDVNASTSTPKYVVTDYNTNQVVVPFTVIAPSAGTIVGSPRVFLLGNYFIIVFGALIAGTNHLQYIAVNTTSLQAKAPIDISVQYTPVATTAFDGVVANNSLYLAWNASDIGGAVRMTQIDSTLAQHLVSIAPGSAGKTAAYISLSADISGSTPIIWGFFFSPATHGYAFAVTPNLSTVLTSTSVISSNSPPTVNLTCLANNGVLTMYYEIQHAYTYDAALPTNYIETNTITQAGVLGTAIVLARSVGLASKAFFINSIPYVLTVYSSSYQPTYFLLNCNTKGVVAKLAYSNASANLTTTGGCLLLGLPSALVQADGKTVNFAYLYKDLIQSVNKTQGVANTAGIYSQSGVNLATIKFDNKAVITTEIGSNLNLTGGIMWAYDGSVPVEQNFNLWPDSVEAVGSVTSGSMSAQLYYYQATYEWTDAQGNIFRSAPSIPAAVTLTSDTSVTVNVPTLRLTYKTANPVKIVLYRWSTAQQSYYQVTSITSPLLNDPTVDYVSFSDTHSDASILGNSLIYTTGGVIEDIAPPATATMTLFKGRLFLVDAEDRNLLWYSKQVIEGTPVEMSDLFTLFVTPTVGAQGNTGPLAALAAMDDKLCLFKADAIYYLTGNGPDNTGANNDFSEPVFITSTVGCANQDSIVFTPNGLMFQSDKGIWLLGRDLSTSYIGAPVEELTNGAIVETALCIPGTNQVRFTLDTGVTLMYDYFFGQWGSFYGISAIASTLYQNLHTYINSYGQVYQETPGLYLDGSNPVLIGFTTSWLNLAGLQGYQRAYFFYILGQYLTPHKLQVSIAYDYNSAPSQVTLISPDNFNSTYGLPSPYGQGNPYGGAPDLEQWRVFLAKQRCQAFQISLQEIYDPSFGVPSGAGLTISGLNVIAGFKSKFRPMPAKNSTG